MTAVEAVARDDRTETEIATAMAGIGEAAREAARELAVASSEHKDQALKAAAQAIRDDRAAILEANETDMAAARERGVKGSFLDRLLLNDDRVEGMAAGLEAVAARPDPIGRLIDSWTRPNGLRISKIVVPLGVIGIIYESRPNVTADAGGLCLKSGNASILRGGSESFHSSGAIAECLRSGLAATGLPMGAIQRVPYPDRAAVGVMLGMVDDIDVIVPRGGRSLIERIANDSRIPVIKHLDGICHVYVDRAADPEIARKVTYNAKMRRTGICGAAETLLVDRSVAEGQLPAIVEDLVQGGCAVRGDAAAQDIDTRVSPANDRDWETEYLDAIISVRVVDGVDAAIDHINRHGSHHTDTIITEDETAAQRFVSRIDSGIVLVNASTQYADGGEFGMGAEIGISTGKLHARGPVGADQLTSYKYVVRGTGQCRP